MSSSRTDVTMEQREVDVVVMGSGGGGLLAALTAARAGARVALVEKASTIGGTTAVSGGVIWVPCNHRMAEAGVTDSREQALTYMTRIADGRVPTALLVESSQWSPRLAAARLQAHVTALLFHRGALP